MSERVVFDVEAETSKYLATISKIPNITEKQAQLAGVRFGTTMAAAQHKAALTAEKAAKQAASAWQGVADHIAGALSADAIAGAVGGVLDYAAEIARARNETIQLAQATDLSLETLGAIGEAAARSGVDVSQITGGFEDFGEVLFDASNNGGRALEALQLLDVAVKDNAGNLRDTDEVMREVIDKFQRMEDGAAKNAVAQQLFGDAGNRLNAVLGDTPLDQWTEAARMSGRVIDEESVAATRRWTEATGELSGALAGFAGRAFDTFASVSDGPIRNFTTGMIFLGEITAGILNEMVDRLGQFGEALKLAYSGDILGYVAAFSEIVKTAPGDLAAVVVEAHAAAEAHRQLGDSLRDTGAELPVFATDLSRVAGASKHAADGARDAAKAVEELQQAQVKAQQALRDATAEAVEQGRERTALQGRELELRAEAEREAYEISTEASAEYWKEERERLKQATEDYREHQRLKAELAGEFANAAFEAGEVIAEAASDNLRENIEETKSANKSLRNQKKSLLEQLENAEDDHTKRAIQREIDRVNAEIFQNKRANDDRAAALERSAAAAKAFALAQIAINTAQAIMAMLALGPLAPLGVGAVAIAGATQAGVVLAEPVPEYYRGTAGAPDTSASVLHEGEAVATAAAVERIGRERIDAANRGQTSSMNGGGGAVYLDSYEVGRALSHEARQPGPLRDVIRSITGGRRRGLRSPY
jgi:hypothetical protein